MDSQPIFIAVYIVICFGITATHENSYERGEQGVCENKTHDPATFVNTETRIVLVGRTGEGKSSTANSILGKRHFQAKPGGKPVIKRCEYTRELVQGKTLALVDTPGVFDTEAQTGETLFEIAKSLILSSPGPHAFLLVLSAQRFTKEIQTSVKILRKAFGEDLLRYTIIVFTRKDDLDYDGISIDEFVKDIPQYISDLLDACDRRYVAFNNRLNGVENQAQVERLLRMVDNLIESNGGEYYTSQIQGKIEDLIRDELREIDEEIEEILPNSSDEEITDLEEEKYLAREKIRLHSLNMSGSCTDGSLVGGFLGAVTGTEAGFLYGGPFGALYGGGIGVSAGYGLGRLYGNACDAVETALALK